MGQSGHVSSLEGKSIVFFKSFFLQKITWDGFWLKLMGRNPLFFFGGGDVE